jgi:type VI secretion system protein VasJ
MEIIELGKAPISSDMPSGEDIRYEPVYEELQNEIEKLSSVTTDSQINWDNVVLLASTILSEKSKNLLVASYLCVGLLQSKGLQGLVSGISMYRGLLEGFWDSLFPPKKRMKGRKNALEWWLEKILEALESLPGEATLPAETKTALSDDLDAIDTFLEQEMEDAPLLNQLKGRLGAIPVPVDSQPEAPSKVEPESSGSLGPVSQVSAAPATPAVTTQETPVEQDPKKILRQGLDTLRQAAALLRQKDPSNALAYRLTRIAAWSEVETLPLAEDGKTRIPEPMKEIVSSLSQLYEQGNFAELLESAEGRVGQFLFWLDLSRYVAESLEHLGYDEAYQNVAEETVRYALRLPGIEKLAFSDGTPFSDGATSEWLNEIVKNFNPSGVGDAAFTRTSSGDSDLIAVDESYNQARALVKAKKLPEALSLLQKFISGAGSQKSKLLGRMRLARLLIGAKKPKLATPHLQEILEDIDRHALEAWEPDLALEALEQVYVALKTQKDETIKNQAASVFDRIAKINSAVAVRLGE